MELSNVVVVIAEDGEFIYGVHDVDAQYAWDQCNDHINDALSNGMKEAKYWHAIKMVRKVEPKTLSIKVVGYQRKTDSHGWVEVHHEDIPHYKSMGQEIRPVYAPAEYVEAPPEEAKNG